MSMPHWQAYDLLRGKGFEVGLSEEEDGGDQMVSPFRPGLRAHRKKVDELIRRVKGQIELEHQKQGKRAQVRGLQHVADLVAKAGALMRVPAAGG